MTTHNKKFTGSVSDPVERLVIAILLFLICRFPQEVAPSSEFLQVPTNIVTIANPLFSKPALEEYLLGKDDLMMNGERDDDQYPVDGALDIESGA